MLELAGAGESPMFAASDQSDRMPGHRGFDQSRTKWYDRNGARLLAFSGARQGTHSHFSQLSSFSLYWLAAIICSDHYRARSCTMLISWPNGVCRFYASTTISFANRCRKACERCIPKTRTIWGRIDGRRCGTWRISIIISDAWMNWTVKVNIAAKRTTTMMMMTVVCAFRVVSVKCQLTQIHCKHVLSPFAQK